MKDLSSINNLIISGNKFLLLLFPADIQQFLKNLSLPILFIGEPLNFTLKVSSQSFNKSWRSKFYISWLNLVSLDNFAYLFQGQIAKQSSHPNILLPISFLNSFGIIFLFSIVKYEIHLVAFNL